MKTSETDIILQIKFKIKEIVARLPLHVVKFLYHHKTGGYVFSGSGNSRFSWTSPYVPQDVRQTVTPRQTPPSQTLPPSARSIPQQPDNHWIVHQISQVIKNIFTVHGD